MNKVLFFGSASCRPCSMMKPVVKKLIGEGHEIPYIDIEDQYEKAAEFKITAVPTFIKMKGNKESHRHVGLMDINRFKNFIND